MSLDKYLPLDQLQTTLQAERNLNKTIALANGGFNLIHIGHIRYLKGAADTADILVVALKSDHSLKGLNSDARAILDETARIRLLCSFYFVDYVTLFSEATADNILFTLKPDFHCYGSDYTVDTVPERETVKSYGGQIAIVGGDKVRSTSTIIRDIRND